VISILKSQGLGLALVIIKLVPSAKRTGLELILKQLKMNITHATEEVNEGMLRKFARNTVKRVDKCIEMNGHHFQHLL